MQALGPTYRPPRPHPLHPSQPIPPWIPAQCLLQAGELNDKTLHGVCCILQPGGFTGLDPHAGPGREGREDRRSDLTGQLCQTLFWGLLLGLELSSPDSNTFSR